MTWTPAVTVTIAGQDFTGATVDLVQLRRGRQNVYSNVQAAVASITLLDIAGTGIVPTVADSLVVTLEDTAGTPVTLFVGEISDFATTIYDAGIRNAAAARIQITAVSNLAKLQRRQVFDIGRPVEMDGDRVLAIIVDGLAARWENAQGDWESLTTQTWQTYDTNIAFDLIDNPGLFDIAALPAQDGGYSAGQIAGEAGLSANGLLYETADGRIGYADGLRRITNVQAGYLQVPAITLSAAQVETTSQLADLANVVVVQYATGEVTETDSTSLQQFGEFSQTLNTRLENLSDAENRAETYLETHAFPTVQFEKAAIRLEQDLDGTLRDALISVEVNDPVEIDNLPISIGLTTFTGFVEGVTFSIDPFRAAIELTVSAAELSIGPTFWAAVPTGIAWEDVDTNLQWQDARSI
jgi:hypothetical protein